MARILIVLALVAALGWIIYKIFSPQSAASPRPRARPSDKPCRWKMRARAQNGFPARWRCSVCNADVAAPEDHAPERCMKIGPR